MDDGASPPDRGAFLGRKTQLRPPWTDEARVRAHCTSCGDCIRACPEAIIVSGPARTPVVDFSVGGCTFCGDCAKACAENVFADLTKPPWGQVAEIGTKRPIERQAGHQAQLRLRRLVLKRGRLTRKARRLDLFGRASACGKRKRGKDAASFAEHSWGPAHPRPRGSAGR